MGDVQKYALVETREGETAHQSFDFTEGATIVGHIADFRPDEEIAILVLEGTDTDLDHAGTDFDTLADRHPDRLYGVDDRGRFRVTGLDMGAYTLIVRETAYDSDTRESAVTMNLPATVTLSDLGDAIMEIQRVR